MTRLPNLCRQDAEIMAKCLRLFNERARFTSYEEDLKGTCDTYALAAEIQRRLTRSGYHHNDPALLGLGLHVSKFDANQPLL